MNTEGNDMFNPVVIPLPLAFLLVTLVTIAAMAVGALAYRAWHTPAWPTWLAAPVTPGRHHLDGSTAQYRPHPAPDPFTTDPVLADAIAYEYDDLTSTEPWDDEVVTTVVDSAAEKTQVRVMYEPGRVPCGWHADSRYGYVDGCPACLIANDTTEVLAAVR